LGALIFIDTSAIVAILTREDDATRCMAGIDGSTRRLTGTHVRLECVMNIMRILGIAAESANGLFDEFVESAVVEIVPIADSTSQIAVSAFARFGKGRGHPAQLNFGDCLSYACAREHNAAILFKGRDFARTDLQIA
jgi:ribonuclease VapC